MGKTCSKCIGFEKPEFINNFEISTGAIPPTSQDIDMILEQIWEAVYLMEHPDIKNLYLFQINHNQYSFAVYISLDNVPQCNRSLLDPVLPKNSSCLVRFKKCIKKPDQFTAVLYRSNYLYRINDISVNEEIRIFNHDYCVKDNISYQSLD